MKALSVWQPWASLIIHGGKDVENRTWRTAYRGELLIHASAHRPTKRERAAFADFVVRALGFPSDIFALANSAMDARGGVIGVVTLVGCYANIPSVWAAPGQWQWLLSNPRPLPFRPLQGTRGLFDVDAESVDG